MRNFFFDLDGTLIDSRVRQYQLFCHLASEANLSFEEYWHLKRQRVSQARLLSEYLGFNVDKIAKFNREWMSRIEEPDRLKLDNPFEGVDGLLQDLSQAHSLYLVTARQRVDLVHMQLSRFQWCRLFRGIFVTQQRSSKEELIERYSACSAQDLMIGDTGEDIAAGKELGLRTIAVCYGTLNLNVLKTYSPDYLVESVSELRVLLKNLL